MSTDVQIALFSALAVTFGMAGVAGVFSAFWGASHGERPVPASVFVVAAMFGLCVFFGVLAGLLTNAIA